MTTPAQFDRLTAIAVPLQEADIDTDRIVPARFLERSRAQGFGDALFHDMRDRSGPAIPDAPPFPLDDPRFIGARILVAGANFGCGSSREQAVHALADAGFRAVIAPSFGDIFRGNCMRNGLLPVTLSAAIVAQMVDALSESGNPVTIELVDQTVRLADGSHYHFDISPPSKRRLMLGLDELDYTLGLRAKITAFEMVRDRREALFASAP